MHTLVKMIRDTFEKNEYYITDVRRDENCLSRTTLCKMSKKEFKKLVKQYKRSKSCKKLYLFENGLVAVF